MRKEKANIFRKLSRSHLEAIGRVAASWSLLEMNMLMSISQLTDVKFQTVITLASPSTPNDWTAMLIQLADATAAKKHIREDLKALCRLIEKLYGRRNYIVHAVWQTPSLHRKNFEVLTAFAKAHAIGIPKRGGKGLIAVEWSPKQMRDVANFIEESRVMLIEICGRLLPTSQRMHDVSIHQGQSNLRRIVEMLTSLPDPLQKLPKT